jgi:enoyl-[acyl-carrier-protein] reductase (NADH)
VFGDGARPSGLWQEVGPSRAKSRGLDPAELREYYRQRNLLRAAVTPEHVGNAVVFFASNQTPTTGATLPVDGGVAEAFPR